MKFWSCRDTARMIASGELEDGPVLARLLARLHLLGCSFCRRYLKELRVLAAAARRRADGLIDAARWVACEKRLITRLRGSL